jgi:hypothetical protein
MTMSGSCDWLSLSGLVSISKLLSAPDDNTSKQAVEGILHKILHVSTESYVIEELLCGEETE